MPSSFQNHDGDRARYSEISHKLRSPLTVIVSTINNFLDGAFGPMKPEQLEWLRKLSIHAKTLESRVTELVDAASVGANQNIPLTVVGPARCGQERVRTTDVQWTRTPRVLIVDDEPDILDTIQEALAGRGFDTATASTGEEALSKALSMPPDLVLMDVHLHGRNGFEVCRQIKSQLASYTPVLLITGQNDLTVPLAALNDDPDDLLMKPFQIPELLMRATSMLRIKSLSEELEKFAARRSA